jgi:hypothetical protein
MLVMVGVALALLRTRRAGITTGLELCLGGGGVVLGLTGDNPAGRLADVGAIQVQPDAPAQLGDRLLCKTSVGAGSADLGALEAPRETAGQGVTVELPIPRMGLISLARVAFDIWSSAFGDGWARLTARTDIEP